VGIEGVESHMAALQRRGGVQSMVGIRWVPKGEGNAKRGKAFSLFPEKQCIAQGVLTKKLAVLTSSGDKMGSPEKEKIRKEPLFYKAM